MQKSVIEFDAVSHVYARKGTSGFRALQSVSLAIEEGSFVAVLGRSGSGKSTLLNLVAGLDRPAEGSVRVAGRDLGAMSEAELTRWRGKNVGVVFQFFQLLPTLSVRENLLIAMEFVDVVAPGEREEKV